MRDLWNWVEAKAFNPKTERTIETWLRCFHLFLHKMWQIELEWNKPITTESYWSSDEKRDGHELANISLKPLRDAEIGFYYRINKGNNGFSIHLLYKGVCFQVEYDTSYIYEFTNDLN